MLWLLAIIGAFLLPDAVVGHQTEITSATEVVGPSGPSGRWGFCAQ